MMYCVLKYLRPSNAPETKPKPPPITPPAVVAVINSFKSRLFLSPKLISKS